jgi:hypothetical protein
MKVSLGVLSMAALTEFTALSALAESPWKSVNSSRDASTEPTTGGTSTETKTFSHVASFDVVDSEEGVKTITISVHVTMTGYYDLYPSGKIAHVVSPSVTISYDAPSEVTVISYSISPEASISSNGYSATFKVSFEVKAKYRDSFFGSYNTDCNVGTFEDSFTVTV